MSARGNKGAGNKGSGKKGGGKVPFSAKKPAGEKRIDPSDGNGPFTRDSFIKFHGQDRGVELWDQAQPCAPGAFRENKIVNKDSKPAPGSHMAKIFESKAARGDAPKIKKEVMKNDGKKRSPGRGGNQGRQPLVGKNPFANDPPAKKGAGKGGAKETGKGGAAAGGAKEKRIDPSDGNGPFTLDSFIRFHGPEKAKQLWAESGPADPAAKTAGKTGGTAGPKKAGDKSRDSLEKEIAALEAQLAAKK